MTSETRQLRAMAPVPENDPLMIAWKAHKTSMDYANTMTWAGKNNEGSLWACFMAGFRANADRSDPAVQELVRAAWAMLDGLEPDPDDPERALMISNGFVRANSLLTDLKTALSKFPLDEKEKAE